MKLFQEFKEFAVKGNMIDMAIGIIIGASFNKVIDVLAKKVLLPPLSFMADTGALENQKYILQPAVTDASGKVITEEVAVAYGLLIQVFIDFLIIALTVFIVVKFMNRLKKKAEDSKDTTVQTPKNIELLSDMRELMEQQNELLKNNLKEAS
ncbi:large conductance mechanosensitive channel protein MscL [Winogradskyella maritima]|uniref:Large-conductance mechanosensitive channel n=1 Tax=Winogradskyella maritima TaxID=1517766 RepID=A0ABV8ACV8_9FLAO|nr:large conductance mechanosensitive channel protein MscL [Winogradskyella maritima]